VDAHGVAGTEFRNFRFELLRLELTNDLGNHLTPSFSLLLLEPASWETACRRAVESRHVPLPSFSARQ
jgi:hypothetical protein